MSKLLESDIKNDIINNINSIIYQRYSNGIKKISINKLLAYIKLTYGLSLDSESIGELLENNPNVDSIENDIILLTDSHKDNTVDDDIHEKAVQQASKELTNQ